MTAPVPQTVKRIARYDAVAETWKAAGVRGSERQAERITPAEAIRAAKRLYRFALGDTFDGKVRAATGNRYNWIRGGLVRTMTVNPSRGWIPLVHELSHYFHRVLHRRAGFTVRPHAKDHARLELRMVKEVIKRGWLDAKLADPAPVPTTAADRHRRKLDSINARIERWESKERRAHRALVKLNRQRRAYERDLP